MRVYEQVFDVGPQTVEQLETVLGSSLEEAFATYSGRQVSGLKPDSTLDREKHRLTRYGARLQTSAKPLCKAGYS